MRSKRQIHMLRRKRPAKIRGHIDLISPSVAEGWVMLKADPSKRLGVEVRLRDRVFAVGQADRFRADLLASRLGDGCYGFRINLPPGLDPAARRALKIFETTTGTEFARYKDLSLETSGNDVPLMWNLLFDKDYYALQLTAEQAEHAGRDLAGHYRTGGWKLGLNPHPLFDTVYYIAEAGGPLKTDPITHFLQEGEKRLLSPHPLCDINSYYEARSDVREAGMHPLLHIVQFGYEGTPPSPFFDEIGYQEKVDRSIVTYAMVLHYLKFGWREGFRPHPSFDPLLYHRLMDLDANTEPYTDFLKRNRAAQRQVPAASVPVRFSFIVLNLSKTLLTLQCITFLRRFTQRNDYEIIIVDNGSNWDEFKLLCQCGSGINIIRLERNLGFGEGNNVGVDEARGEFLVFLNNDVFVTRGWLDPLLGALEADPSVGAVGPKLLFADGTLQEAGGTLSSCGASIQHGKGLDADNVLFNENRVVDYCSAATLLMRTESFKRVLGYDLCYDPAYYEDADLCLKLRLIGQKVVYVAASQVIHLEHTTAADQTLNLHIGGVTQTNRVKFVARWGHFLAGRSDGTAERALIPPEPHSEVLAPVRTKRLALYSAYPLTPGGGERYLLSLAVVLSSDYACTLYTHDRYSRTRLATLARELDLPLDHVTIKPWTSRGEDERADVFICMSNEILPGVPAFGRRNLFLCQFPFPMSSGVYARDWANLRGYDAMLVYSRFVLAHAGKAASDLGLHLPPCHVLAPPVPQVIGARPSLAADGPFRIVNVGRFTPAGHCKRQDVMIDTFREIASITSRPIELHLAGALGGHAFDREYLASLQRAARRLPVSFHVNVTPDQIHALYRKASVYWHMTGANDDITQKPERFEHFGITIGEAMSAGVIPITLRHGGPGEIVSNGVNGFLVLDANALRERTLSLIEGGVRDAEAMRAAARARAADFSMGALEEHLRAIIAAPDRLRV